MSPVTRSTLRHPVAALRNVIGYNQAEFARLVGCSLATIQSIEVGRLKLSPDLASRIALATGVRVGWLSGSPTSPIVATSGRSYTKDEFDRVQAEIRRPARKQKERTQFEFSTLAAEIFGTLSAATTEQEFSVLCYKFDQAIKAVTGRPIGLMEVEQSIGVDIAKLKVLPIEHLPPWSSLRMIAALIEGTRAAYDCWTDPPPQNEKLVAALKTLDHLPMVLDRLTAVVADALTQHASPPPSPTVREPAPKTASRRKAAPTRGKS